MCDLDHLTKLYFPLPRNLVLICHAALEKTKFENNVHIHVYSPGAGADTPLVKFQLHKPNYPVNLILCCKFSKFMTL